jgi:hypothetical protein
MASNTRNRCCLHELPAGYRFVGGYKACILGERCLYSLYCREGEFSETRMQLVEILCPRLLGAADPEKMQERMRVALDFAREGLGG